MRRELKMPGPKADSNPNYQTDDCRSNRNSQNADLRPHTLPLMFPVTDRYSDYPERSRYDYSRCLSKWTRYC
jgi:hypothetical protein